MSNGIFQSVAQFSFPVFPVKISKHPSIPNKFTKRPLTPRSHLDRKPGPQWTEAEWPAEANGIAFVPADRGWVCIDLDEGHDAVWADANLPPTRTHQTPSGNYHLFYDCPGERFGNAKFGPNIDTRGSNGWVPLPDVSEGYSVFDGDNPLPLPDAIRKRLIDASKPKERAASLEGITLTADDPVLNAELRAAAEAYVAKYGVGNDPRGDRAYALANLLADKRNGDNTADDETIFNIMHDVGFGDIGMDVIDRRARGDRGIEQITFDPPDPDGDFAEKFAQFAIAADPAPGYQPPPRILTHAELRASEFQPPEYLWDKLILRRHLNLLYGDGKVGKTMLALHLALATAGEIPLFGHSTVKMPVLLVLGEDDYGAIKSSVGRIAGSLNLDEATLDIRYICRPGEDLTIAQVNDDGRIALGDFYKELVEHIRAGGPESLVFLDNASIVGDLNENFKRPVQAFLRRVMGELIVATGCTPVILAHPTAAGLKEGGTGGARAWRNATRNLLTFERVDKDPQDPRRKLTAGGNYGDAHLGLWMDGPVLSLASGRTARENDKLMGMLIQYAKACYDDDDKEAIKRPTSRRNPTVHLQAWELQTINDATGVDLRPAETYRQLERAVSMGFLRYQPYVKNGPKAGYAAGPLPWLG